MAYDSAFFAGQSTRSLSSARESLGLLFACYRPQSVVDVGCGVGPWLCAAGELGAKEVLGVDGDYVDRQRVLFDRAKFLALDLENTRLSDALPSSHFDLAMCMEVAEHLTYRRATTLVDDLTKLSDVVLFSAAVPFQGGETHVNEQWPEFWAMLFRQKGYDCADFLRDKLWANPSVDWWYAQNMLVFFRRGGSGEKALRPHAVCQGAGLSRIHPTNYLDQVLKWHHTYRDVAAGEEYRDYSSLTVAFQAGSTDIPRLEAIQRAAAHPTRKDVFPHTRSERSSPEQVFRTISEIRASRCQRIVEKYYSLYGIPVLGQILTAMRSVVRSLVRILAKLLRSPHHMAREFTTNATK